MSIFLVETKSKGLDVRPIRNMVNHETNAVFIDNLEIPAENMIGEEGKGFRYILDGLNAERILIAAECIGDGYWFIDKSLLRQGPRRVRPADRPEPGHPVPDRRGVHGDRGGESMRYKASGLFDEKSPAPKRTWRSTSPPRLHGKRRTCPQTHGGFGFAAEYDVERKFRENRLYLVAPISTNLILSYLAEHVLELPRSF